MSEQLGLTKKKQEDFSEWYLELVEKAGIVDLRYGVKGFQIFLPMAMLPIKQIIRLFENQLELTGHKPVLFPSVIPESSIAKEAEHIKGFATEVFWITHAGKNKLEERLCLRPTSETAFYPMYSTWIRSHIHLPLKLYQTGTIFRYETKMTKPLLRSREFIWIETHTAQKTDEEAKMQVEEDMKIFKKVVTDDLGVYFISFKRPDWDKFPGAVNTYAFETMMPDGKVLQLGTTHNLGEKFAKVFNIKYMDVDKNKKYVKQTCLGPGISRILGALIAIHSDDKGLIFPPTIAPLQIVIVPIYTGITRTKVLEKAAEIFGRLENRWRAYLDDREQYTPGFKFNEWELKGVPLRIEIGPKDIEKQQVVLVRRDFRERIPIAEDKLESEIIEAFDSIFFNLKKKAQEALKITDAKDYKNLKEKLKEGGFIRIDFCMQEGCAEKLKEETKAEVRGTLFGRHEKAGEKCTACGKPAKEKVYVARAY